MIITLPSRRKAIKVTVVEWAYTQCHAATPVPKVTDISKLKIIVLITKVLGSVSSRACFSRKIIVIVDIVTVNSGNLAKSFHAHVQWQS